MSYIRIPLGPLQTNCYIIQNEKEECLIFDPGEEGNALVQLIENKGIKPIAILLTHAHFDHIGAVETIREKWDVPLYIHENEQEWLQNPALNGSQYFRMGAVTARPATHLIKKEGILTVGDFECEVRETPGHSPGSVSYYFNKSGLIVSGDVLFEGGIGRTDLPGGNQQQLIQSIHTKILSLPEETIVLSGHGSETTVGNEMYSNPFLNGF